MENVGSRVESIVNHYMLNVSSFSKIIGLTSNVTIFKIVKGESAPSFATLTKIKKAYPEVNIDWILSGEGQMIIDNQKDVSWYEKQLENAKKEIEWHRSLVDTLKMAIHNQTIQNKEKKSKEKENILE